MDGVQDIRAQLGITNRSEAEQEQILDEYDVRVGEAISAGLSDEQFAEFKAITYGEQTVIDGWLAENVPDYKQTDLYKELVQNEGDIHSDKIYATVGWMEKNVPDYPEIAARVLDEYKKELTDSAESETVVQ